VAQILHTEKDMVLAAFQRASRRHAVFNEGKGPVNWYISWDQPWCLFFVYVYAFGASFDWCLPRR
jgi:hypothetical protein